jgi:uncharacterized cupredoxin-like copper-binding protein
MPDKRSAGVMKRLARRLALVFGVGMVVALLLGGCGGGTPSAPSTTESVEGTRVTVTETEYSIDLSTMEFTSGTYTFALHNQGAMPHNLNVSGPGVTTQTSTTVQPGGTGDLTVTLQSGTYEIWCSIDGHKDMGMDRDIQVS